MKTNVFEQCSKCDNFAERKNEKGELITDKQRLKNCINCILDKYKAEIDFNIELKKDHEKNMQSLNNELEETKKQFLNFKNNAEYETLKLKANIADLENFIETNVRSNHTYKLMIECIKFIIEGN